MDNTDKDHKVIKKKAYLVCEECKIDSNTKGRMIPCPRGGCEAVVKGEIITTTETKLRLFDRKPASQKCVAKNTPIEKTPKNKQWIVAIDNDSFNYFPSLELISACKKEKITGYRKKITAQRRCDRLNSM